jgi:hypothetical protein
MEAVGIVEAELVMDADGIDQADDSDEAISKVF